jgi:hypothetical protein
MTRYLACVAFAVAVACIGIGFFQETDTLRLIFASCGAGIALLALIAALLVRSAFLRRTVMIGVLLLGVEASLNYLMFCKQAASERQRLHELRLNGKP